MYLYNYLVYLFIVCRDAELMREKQKKKEEDAAAAAAAAAASKGK